MQISEKYKEKYLGMRETMRINTKQFGMSADFLYSKPNDAFDYRYSIQYYFFEGDFGKCGKLLADGESKFPGSPELALARGIILQYTGKPEEALEQIDAALSKNGSNLEFAIIKADLLLDLKKYREALQFLKPYESSNPDSYHLLLYLAMFSQSCKEFPQSLDYATRARQCQNYDPNIEKYLTQQIAYSHQFSGDAKEAVKILQKYCEGKGFDKDLKYQIMFAAEKDMDYSLMTKSATEILKMEKTDATALFFRGFGNYISGRFKNGLKDGNRLVHLYPNSEDGYIIRILNLDGLGYTYEKMKDDIEMLEKLERLEGKGKPGIIESVKSFLRI